LIARHAAQAAGLNARNLLRPGAEGHSSAMATKNNAAGRRNAWK